MFTLTCEATEPHGPHQHEKIWVKAELPYLRLPETYPDTWKATYRCPGRVDVTETTHWDTVQIHTACPECEQCIDDAIAMVKAMQVPRWTIHNLPHGATVKVAG